MNTRRPSFWLHLSQLLLLFFILLMPSCECGNFFNGKKKTVVVLLHGLNAQKEGMSFLEQLRQKLADDLSDEKDVTVLAPARTQSFTDSLDEQVKALHTLLQQSHKDCNLVVYGHSQGAVLAAYLWCKHSNDLAIKALILDRGPLMGFDPFSTANEDTTHKLKTLIPVLMPLIIQKKPEKKAALEVLQKCVYNFDSDGVQDLSPESDVIKEIGSKLPNVDVPVILITAKADKFLEEEIKKEIQDEVLNCGVFWIWNNCTPEIKADFENHDWKLQTFLQDLKLQTLFGDPNDGFISLKSQNFNDTTHANIERIDAGNYDKSFAHGLPIESMQEVYDKLLARIKSHITTD